MKTVFPGASWLPSVVVLLLLLPLPLAAQYVGAAKCRPCHLPQFKSWQGTRMAKSFDLLKPGVAAEAKIARNVDPNKDYTTDAECLSCHTTSYGQPGGFVSVAETPKLVGVQCEVCHGPGAGYLKPELMSLKNKDYKRSEVVAAGMIIPSKELCASCHNEKSPFYKPFDYEARKKEGTHKHIPLKFPHE